MMGLVKILGLFLCLAVAIQAKAIYEGNSVWRITINSENERNSVNALADMMGYDVWAQGKGWMDVMVDSSKKGQVLKVVMQSMKLQHVEIISDVQKLIDEQANNRLKQEKEFSLEHYNTWSDIEAYLTALTNENDNAELLSLGKTVEDRDMWMVKVSSGEGKKSIWIDCGIHAREWITPATCLYGIDNLVKGSTPEFQSLLDAYDVYIMPVHNPDGYAYTYIVDRLWRKNRNQHPGDECVGIDLNRNYEFEWGGSGASDISCSSTYRGPSAASEPEVQNAQNKIREMASNIQALYSIHSYSQLWMYAFGYTYDIPPENDDLSAASKVGVDALTAVHGTAYEYGPIASTIYIASGSTVDFGYNEGIVHSYTLELRDTGSYGFLLPEDQIIPTAEETWVGLVASILSIQK